MCGGMGAMGSMEGGMGVMGPGQGQPFARLLGATLSFLGQLASQILVIVTSSPVLGLLAALVLLLAVAALLRVLLDRHGVAR